MLGKLLTAIDEPEFMLVALHPNVPGMIRQRWLVLPSSVLSINKGFSADGHTNLRHRPILNNSRGSKQTYCRMQHMATKLTPTEKRLTCCAGM